MFEQVPVRAFACVPANCAPSHEKASGFSPRHSTFLQSRRSVGAPARGLSSEGHGAFVSKRTIALQWRRIGRLPSMVIIEGTALCMRGLDQSDDATVLT